jgi:hypothetical protein
MYTRKICLISALLMTLVGCNTTDYLVERYEWRWGPDPAIPRSDVQTVIGGQIQVLDYITWQTFQVHYEDAPKTSPNFWFKAAEWGFNVGRQDCEIYLDYMFRMSREKQRDDGIIAGVSAATSAIVAATTHNAAKTLSVLAASFGLATALNDAIFSSYLFTEAPGLISVKIKDLQDTYQQQVEKNQIPQQVTTQQVIPKVVTTNTTTQTKSSSPSKPPATASDSSTAVVAPITTADQAYGAIQNYYHICLPHAIEGVLLQAVADSSAKSTSPSTSSTPKLTTTTK